MGMCEGNTKVVKIKSPHLSGSQYGGSTRGLNYSSGLYVRPNVLTQGQNSIQNMNSFSIERDGAFRHNALELEQIILHTRYISYVQELNLNIALLAMHYHRYLSKTMHPRRPHVAYCQSTPTRWGRAAICHANGVTNYMTGSPRISYPLLSPIPPKYRCDHACLFV